MRLEGPMEFRRDAKVYGVSAYFKYISRIIDRVYPHWKITGIDRGGRDCTAVMKLNSAGEVLDSFVVEGYPWEETP